MSRFGLGKGLGALIPEHQQYFESGRSAEETGVEIEVKGIVGVRTRYDEQGGAVLVIFRGELVSGEPRADDYEISAAEFLDAGQIAALAPVFPLSREVGLRVLRDNAPGLTEAGIPPSSGAQWKAFTIG